MAAARLTPVALRAAPVATLAVLALWAATDALSIGSGRGSVVILEGLAFGIAVLVVAAAFRWSWIRPIGLGLVVVAYASAHAFFLGVQLLPALLFLVVLICHIELGVLETRFAPLFRSALASTDLERIRAALGRAVLRLGIAATLAILIPMLAADLALAGVVALNSIPTAIILAGGLVVVVLAIALLPRIEREST